MPGSGSELELLRAIIDGTSDGIFVKDRGGRYILCNEAAAKLVGRRAVELLGRRDADLFSSEIAQGIHQVDERIMTSGESELVDDIDVENDRVLQTRKFPLRDAAGNVIGLVGVSRDVTDRVRMERELARREQLLRVVLEALPIGVVVLDANGDILLANPAFAAIWGDSIPDAQQRWRASRGWWHGTNTPVQPHEWASVHALRDGEPRLDQIIDIEGFDHVRRTIRNSAVPLAVSGGAIIVVEDITERIRLQHELAQASQLEALGRLAGGVAHDFNNLLMVIASYAELVIASLLPDDPRRRDLREITRAADSATHLTRQLLAFGRRQTSQPQLVVVEDAVADVGRLLARVLGVGIHIELALAETRHTVFIDPVQLEQILVNLAVNARDAMPDGGVLTLSTRSAEPGRVVIGVRDNGIGMDESTRARIFEPFFTTKERGRGTGLGLATVYGLVEQHGGRIAVTSELRKGTLFEIELPVRAAASGELAAVPSEVNPVAGHSVTILLVEDVAPLRAAVRAMLTSLGYVVHAVAGVQEALDYVRGGGVAQLLLTDLNLDGHSGRDLAASVRTLRPDIRVLLMSGYPDDEELEGETSASRVLAKPFSIPALEAAIQGALARPAPV